MSDKLNNLIIYNSIIYYLMKLTKWGNFKEVHK